MKKKKDYNKFYFWTDLFFRKNMTESTKFLPFDFYELEEYEKKTR